MSAFAIAQGRSVARLAHRYGAAAALVVVCAFGTLRYETFLTPENLLNVARQNSMLGLVALGTTFVIVSGGIDLSVGSVVALGGIAAAALSRFGGPVALLAALAVGGVAGACNGWLIVRARIQPFITTLAMMIGLRGLTLAITDEVAIRADRTALVFRWIGRGFLGPIPAPVVILVMAYAAGALVLRRTRFGRHVHAIGDNEEAARLMGLDVNRVKLAVYTCNGVLAAFAGALLASRLGAGQPAAGTGWELDAIAAVVVGGTLLSGGHGGAGSTLVGVMLLGIVLNLFNLEGTVSSWWQLVLRGGFLLAVILVQRRTTGGRSPLPVPPG